MGFPTTGNYIMSNLGVNLKSKSTGVTSRSVSHSSVLLFNVHCYGYESKLLECFTQFRNPLSVCTEDAGVQCRKQGINN